MADVLSQSEIDALLSSISSGDVDPDEVKNSEKEKKIKVYDFRRPDKFSKDQLRTLQIMHETFSRLVTTMVSGQLRTNASVQVVSVDQITYEEFIRSVPEVTVMGIFNMGGLEGNAILQMGLDISYSIIDRLFGGDGHIELGLKEMTDIESTIMERFTARLLGYLSDAWSDVIEVIPRIEQMENNPQFVQVVGPTEMMVLLNFEITIGDRTDSMNIAYPTPLIDPIASKLSAQYWFSNVKKDRTDENISRLRDRLNKVALPIVANLGHTTLSFEQLINLTTGDVIPLAQKIDNPIEIIVGSRKKFKAVPGIDGNKTAISITDVIDDDERGE